MGLVAVLAILVVLAGVTVSDLAYQPAWVFPLVMVVAFAVAAFLFLTPGQRGANRYGELPPDPWRSGRAAEPNGQAGTMLFAATSIIGSALLAYGAIATMQGMREAHERDARWADAHRGEQLPVPLAR